MNTRDVIKKAMPFILVIFLQLGLSGMDIIAKVALNLGMSSYVYVVYRHAVAFIVMAPFAYFLDRGVRPNITISIFVKLLLLGLLEPVIGQNFYFLGMEVTTATFTVAMCNVLPAMTFVMAWMLRIEVVNLRKIRSQAKVIGTITTVAGAMVMTLVRGPLLELFWTKGRDNSFATKDGVDLHHSIKGAWMITLSCMGWSSFMILQEITLRSYPAELSLTAWICLLGTAEAAIVALVMERGDTTVWEIMWDSTLIATLYSGVVCSGLAYYFQALIMKERDAVFVTAFTPLNMIIVAFLGSLILAEKIYLGGVLGAIVICAGLYLVIWGKSRDQKRSFPSHEAAPTQPNRDPGDLEQPTQSNRASREGLWSRTGLV